MCGPIGIGVLCGRREILDRMPPSQAGSNMAHDREIDSVPSHFAEGLAFVPTLITRAIVFGGFFRFGFYSGVPWDWTARHWRSVLLSSEHGLLSWTPILVLSLAGLVLPGLSLAPRSAKCVAAYLSVGGAAFYYLISSYPDWHGMASFGNRFFISLTAIFIFGLALFLQRIGGLFRS